MTAKNITEYLETRCAQLEKACEGYLGYPGLSNNIGRYRAEGRMDEAYAIRKWMLDRDADDWDRGKEHARQEKEEREAHQ